MSFLNNTSTVTAPSGQLTTFTLGTGRNLVIFESGLGQNAAYWGTVAEELASSTVRVVGYDRAGFGTSTGVSDNRSLPHLVADLLAVIRAQDGYDSLVLVGHSYGAPMIRCAAGELASDEKVPLMGLVLVDGSDEECAFYFRPEVVRAHWKSSWMLRPRSWTGALGRALRQNVQPLPEPYVTAVVEGAGHDKAARAASWELWNFVPGLESLKGDGDPDVSHVKMTIISAQKDRTPGSLRDQIIEAHKARCARTGAKYVPAENSSHFILCSEPELVARETREMFE